jgi:hypothetical protein
MSLVQLFYAKETFRERLRQWRLACFRGQYLSAMTDRRVDGALRQRIYRHKNLTVGFPPSANRFVDRLQDIRGEVARAAFETHTGGDVLEQNILPSGFSGQIDPLGDDSAVAVFAPFVRPEPVRLRHSETSISRSRAVLVHRNHSNFSRWCNPADDAEGASIQRGPDDFIFPFRGPCSSDSPMDHGMLHVVDIKPIGPGLIRRMFRQIEQPVFDQGSDLSDFAQ